MPCQAALQTRHRCQLPDFCASSLQEAARQGHCEITLPDPLPDCLDFEVLTLVGLPGALLLHYSVPLSCSLPGVTCLAASFAY